MSATELPDGIRQRGKRSFQIRYTSAGGTQEETIKGPTPEAALEEAIRTLAIRRGTIAAHIPTTSKPHTVTFLELCGDAVREYEANKYSSRDDLERRFRLHLLPFFGPTKRAAEITTADFTEYHLRREAQGSKIGNTAREMEAARLAFRLAMKATPPKIMTMPYIPIPAENNVRQGFFERGVLESLCTHLPKHLVPVVWFGYYTGWRHDEVLTRTLGHVDFKAGEIRLDPGETKNKKGRTFPMTDDLRMLLKGIWPEGPVFPTTLLFRSPEGGFIRTFYKAWATACRKTGLPVVWKPKMQGVPMRDVCGTVQRDDNGKILYKRDAFNQMILVPQLHKRGAKKGQPIMQCRAGVHFHDFRRTAYRNLVRLGVPQSVAQKAVGWLDPHTASRYDIVAQADLDVLREKMNAASKSDQRLVKKRRILVKFPASAT